MRTVSVREVQHHFARILQWVAAGEVIEVTRRNKPVARIGAPEPGPDHAIAWPDWEARARRIMGDRVLPGNVVLEEREGADR